MSEENNTVTEAVDDDKILFHYELAFHILPTVAEGELTKTFQSLQDLITKAGGEITTMEEPQRFELVYDIVKSIEGRNRKFSSAYFGWIRFIAPADTIGVITEEIKDVKKILRYLLIKLTKDEVENPFYFHQSLSEEKMAETIDELAGDEDEDVKETDDNTNNDLTTATEVDTTMKADSDKNNDTVDAA